MRIACCCANAGGTRTCRNCLTTPILHEYSVHSGTRPRAHVESLLAPCLEVAHVVTPVVHENWYPPGLQLADQLLEVFISDIAVECQVGIMSMTGTSSESAAAWAAASPCPPRVDPSSPSFFLAFSSCSFFSFFSSRCNALLGTMFWVWHIAMYTSDHK